MRLALGDLVVGFGELESAMEVGVIAVFGLNADYQRMIRALVAGERGTEPARTWTSLRSIMMIWIETACPDDAKQRCTDLVNALNKEILGDGGLVNQRNRLLHDRLVVGLGSGSAVVGNLLRVRQKPGGDVEWNGHPVEEIEGLARQCLECAQAVQELTSSIVLLRPEIGLPFTYLELLDRKLTIEDGKARVAPP